jgi:hypothetical protein
MLGTVMAQPQSDPVSRQTVWRQLVDILAQTSSDQAIGARKEALGWLAANRGEIVPAVRASVARSIARPVCPPDLVAYFAGDDAAIAAPLLRCAVLPADQWRDILPAMPSASRALLRERRDLPVEVGNALSSFGSADFALQAPRAERPDVPPIVADIGQTPIADIVARIEAFRAQRASEAQQEQGSLPRDNGIDAGRATDFVFETNVAGDIDFVSGPCRAALCGISIAVAGEGWLFGVDGHAAGAFRAHTSFARARLRVGGASPAAGDWLIDGTPMFDATSGKFLGYHGSARRPMPHERAELSSTEPPASDSMRQLVHELRTPLNAIHGFAEMIERELLGPIAAVYRERAQMIIHQSQRILALIEDIDAAAHVESHITGANPARSTDAAALLTLVARELSALSDERNVHLRVARSPTEMVVNVASSVLHRLISRLLSAMMTIADENETLETAVVRAGDHVEIRINRPRVILGRKTQDLLDPDHSPEGHWPDAPLLGLAFGLRLIGNLAQAADVNFRIGDETFVLILPTTPDSATRHIRTPFSYGDDRHQDRPPSAQ